MQSRPDEPINQTFDKLYEVIRSNPFLERKGLGNDMPFFISAFHPTLQARVDVMIPLLATRLSNQGVSVLTLDLYDLCVELLKKRGIWDRLLATEPTKPKDLFFNALTNATAPDDQLIPLIQEKLAEAHYGVILITGVGLVYPFIRSHNVLENLQKVTKQIPTVLFFPGDYSFVENKGSYLKLFGTLPDDRYYRAFNISDFHP